VLVVDPVAQFLANRGMKIHMDQVHAPTTSRTTKMPALDRLSELYAHIMLQWPQLLQKPSFLKLAVPSRNERTSSPCGVSPAGPPGVYNTKTRSLRLGPYYRLPLLLSYFLSATSRRVTRGRSSIMALEFASRGFKLLFLKYLALAMTVPDVLVTGYHHLVGPQAPQRITSMCT
jgi:hypothetical protein